MAPGDTTVGSRPGICGAENAAEAGEPIAAPRRAVGRGARCGGRVGAVAVGVVIITVGGGAVKIRGQPVEIVVAVIFGVEAGFLKLGDPAVHVIAEGLLVGERRRRGAAEG